MRKLGIKNRKLFILLVVLVLLAISLFSYFIFYSSHMEAEEYTLAEKSVLYDINNNYLSLETSSVLKKAFDGNYYIETSLGEDNYKIGKNAVVYNSSDYQMYIYGVAYQVYEDGSVRKTEKQETIVKSNGPFFYKLGDRKYLMIDSRIFSEDQSIDTSEYLIVELDKQGNATLTNHEINVKTINPLILKGSKYDFNVVHEKLIVGEKTIDLKNIIGSTNEYVDKDYNVDDAKEENNTNNTSDYYNDYLNKVVDSFTNLYNSVGNINNSNKEENNDDIYLDLTRWLSLNKVTSSITSITLDYTVFDPNNEYSQVFLEFKPANSEEDYTRIYLSKEQTSYTIYGLNYNQEYTIQFGYVLAMNIDEYQTPVVSDTVKAKTQTPEISLKIQKITSSKIYYEITFDKNYNLDSAIVGLYSDNELLKEISLTKDMISEGTYQGSFDYESLGFLVEVRMRNIVYDGDVTDLSYSAKYVNRTE